MIDIGGESIIERQIRLLKACNIENIIVVVGYKFETVVISNDVKKVVNFEYNSTGNAYSLSLALQFVYDDCIVLDGDLIFQKSALLKLINNKNNVFLALNKETDCAQTGILMDENGNVKDIGKHVYSDITYANMMKINKENIEVLKNEVSHEDVKERWYTIPLAQILNKITFKVEYLDSDFYEINTYSDYLDIKELLNNNIDTVMITGANGFLGNKIYNILKRDYQVIGTCGHGIQGDLFDVVDLTNYEHLNAYISSKRPSIIINTAGIAEPEICEQNRYLAEKVNVFAVENLVKICRLYNVKLIHISTDYVFDGDREEDYGKFDDRHPKNYYGETKALAEDIVSNYANSLIVRIPIIYGFNDEYDKETFPTKILKSLKSKKKIVVDDTQIRYPVLIDEVAFSIKKSLNGRGIIHVTSNTGVTKFEWAKIIAEVFGLDKTLIECCKLNLKDRPMHTHLSVSDSDYAVSDVLTGTQIMRNQMKCVFKLIYKSLPFQNIYGKNVGEYRYELGKKLAKSIPENVKEKLDYIVPVPTSGIYYAIGLAEQIGIPYLQALVKPDVKTRSFQIADIGMREKIIKDKIYAIKELLKDKTIALVDEAIFTGTTLRVVSDMVWACGVKDVYICIPTPICRNNCHQYVQPYRKMICENENIDLKEYFHVKDVFFQKYENFENSLSGLQNSCNECFARRN
jgi:amidophosphoribosyltransferase